MTTPTEDLNSAGAAVLEILMGSREKKVHLKELERMTGLDRKSVKRVIGDLRDSGIEIDDKRGYSVKSVPDIITAPILMTGLKSRNLGRSIYSYRSIGSTNETARRLAESGSPEGTVVIADRQTRGRGRLGRTWHSPSGVGLYFSLILRPTMPFNRFPGLSLVAALSICRVIENMGHLKPKIKWPNDCLIDKQKMAGILVEISAELDKISYAILGVGININHGKKDFPMNLRSRATSLALKSGQRQDRAEFLREFLREFEKNYLNFTRYGLRFIGRALVERSSVIGRKVSVKYGKKKISGTAVGLDENGALRIRTKDGVESISAGEVNFR